MSLSGMALGDPYREANATKSSLFSKIDSDSLIKENKKVSLAHTTEF
jgi:hypothetical protein